MILKIKDNKHTTFIFESVERYSFQAQDLIIIFEDYTFSSIPIDDVLTIEIINDPMELIV